MISKLIHNRRKELGLTQARLAELSKLRKATISDIERGAIQPRSGTIEKILKVLKLEIKPAD